MWGWDSICSAARKVDRTVREDAPAKLKQYTPDPKQLQHVVSYCSGSLSGRYPAEKMSEIQKNMRSNWDYLREKAPEPRTLLTAAGYALEQIIPEIIEDSGLPGAKPLHKVAKHMYRFLKESQHDRSGVASQLHSHDKDIGERISIHDEREMAVEREKYMALLREKYMAVEREKYMALREELQRMVRQTLSSKR